MAGSNFIGVNLCFATGYSQTYIVDPLSNTYNVGDYITITGGGEAFAVVLTATTASSASWTGTSPSYGTFLEALQEVNRQQTGSATDFCIGGFKGPIETTCTPTPTQTLPDIYWFSGCCLINNITFGLYNLPVSVVVGKVYYVEIEGIFSGCSTVITTGIGGIYKNSTLVNYTDCDECIVSNPCVPIPSVTPTPTVTQTPNYITINFEYVSEFLTPTQTLTPSITPTETLPPYLNESVYLYFELAPPTPTPNIMTPTPTQTTTVTPTLTPGLTGCAVYQYCIHLGNPDYDGTYVNSGDYNGNTYYLNSGTSSVIYYDNTTWCVSDTLGGTCILYGSVPPTSPCPSFSNTVFSVGACPTPTPTPTTSVTPTLTPTVSPTPTLTPTPAVTTSPSPTPTVTPTGTNVCIGVQAYSIIQNVPNLSPTPTVTPTSTVGKVSFNGEGVFVALNDTFVYN